MALQSLRVAFQHHLRVIGEQQRDESMAENTEWISRRIGPEGRMVLWAHNFHVATRPGVQGSYLPTQGSYLRETFGDDMVVVGFSHEGGRFTARHSGLPDRDLREHELDAPLPGSYEHYLSTASFPRLVLDLRGLDPDAPGSSWLAVSRMFRVIGAVYNPANRARYWQPTPLAERFDVIIHFERTRATTVLPFLFPDSF